MEAAFRTVTVPSQPLAASGWLRTSFNLKFVEHPGPSHITISLEAGDLTLIYLGFRWALSNFDLVKLPCSHVTSCQVTGYY